MKKKNYLLLLLVSIYFIQPVLGQRGGWYLYDRPGVVYNVVKDSAGNFHMATSSGYVKLSSSLEVLEHVTLFNNLELNTNVLKAVTINPLTGNVVLCTDKGEILEKDGNTFTPINYNPTTPYSDFTKIWVTSTNEVIVKGAWAEPGLHLLSNGTWTELDITDVNDFIEGPNGLWLFATAYGGLRSYNATSQQWSQLPNSPVDSTEWVSDLLLDKSTNSIFIATSNNGIFEYKTDSSSVNYKEFNLSGISQIFKVNDTLHVTHLGAGYSKCVLPSNTWTNYNPNNSTVTNNFMYSAFPVDGGVLLQLPSSLIKFQPNKDSVSKLILNKEGVDFNNFYNIQVRKVGDDMQFFGTTYQHGLVFRNGQDDFQYFTTKNSILTSTEFTDLDMDANGTVWVSTKDGLYSIDTVNNWIKYDSTNSNGLLRGNNVTNFSVGRTDDDHSVCAASTLGSPGLVVAADFPGSSTLTKTIDSTDNVHFSNKVTSFGIGRDKLLVGTGIGTLTPVSLSIKNLGLNMDFGYHFQARPDSGEVREINHFAFEAGLKTEYHFNDFFSVHTEVGFVFALVNQPNLSGLITGAPETPAQPSDTSALNKATLGLEAVAFGNAGFTVWFKSGIKRSYLFGYDRDADEPLRYFDLNNLADSGSVQITDLNLAPNIYSIVAMPNSDNKISLYLNTSMGLLIKSDFEVDNTTTGVSASSTLGESVIKTYPNPAEKNINIAFNESVIGNYEVEIRDLNGRLLIETQNQNTVNVEQLATGVYLISVTIDGKSTAVMFYKK